MLAAKLGVLLGFAAIMAFLIFLLTTQGSMETRLDCDRARGTCVFTYRLAKGTSSTWQPIAGLGPAHVRVSSGGRRARPVIAVWIHARNGDSYFDDYPTRREAQGDADRINFFLQNPADPRLSLYHDHRKIYGAAWALAVIMSGLVGFLGWVLFLRKEPAAAVS